MNLFIEINKNNKKLPNIIECLNSNLRNVQIHKIYIFTDNSSIINLSNNKLNIIEVSKRVTFKDYFDYINSNVNSDDICIISNNDIEFDNSLIYINDKNINGKFLAINKWSKGEVTQGNSQDTWVFKSPINIKNCDFLPFNLGGDNSITYLANEADYIVTNPCGSVITKSLDINEREGEMLNNKHCYLRLTKDINVISPNKIKV